MRRSYLRSNAMFSLRQYKCITTKKYCVYGQIWRNFWAMIQISIKNKIFRDVLETIVPIREETILKFTKENLNSRITDYGNVALVEVSVPTGLFNDYLLDEDIEMGLNAKNLLLYTKLGNPEDNIKIEITDRFKMLLDNFEIDMDILDPTYMTSVSKLPDEFECKCLVSIDEIRKIARAANQIRNDTLIFELDNLHENLTISTESEKESIRIETYVIDTSDKKSTHNLKSAYPVDFILGITNTLYNLGMREIEMSFGNEFPMQLSSFLHETGKVIYYIAPRVID